MGIIFIIKHFKQIAMRVKPQADIAVTGVRTLNRTIIAGICERMANISLAQAVPENRLLELNFNIHLLNIVGTKRECNVFRKIIRKLNQTEVHSRTSFLFAVGV
jgi:hypothetical protein